MVYVSSTCAKAETINEAVTTLAEDGYKNIELSGGTNYYEGYKNDLLRLQDKHSLNYLVHNYFPPPMEPFILNLASLDDDLYKKSINHCKLAIKLSKKLGSKKYGIHAGYLLDFPSSEAGKRIAYRSLNNRRKALNRFCEAWDIVTDIAGQDVQLYIENNVFSKTNSITYNEENPFLFTDYEGYLELKEKIDFRVLLDLAHLKISANSLGLSFKGELKNLLPLTDYIHLSGNDGLHDQNLGLESDPEIVSVLAGCNLNGKSVTLEVYGDTKSLMGSFKTVQEIVN